ncbi:HMG box-containing protein C19G7.04 [Psilocybe cubensis]|uniref:HMG box-containing protein C19G7.04 n=1 Tax=Psilocybe cubensis TaxID=181762 RepID=A0ACB8HFU6_PSICU|nr:HMG box-containing protein C19G7.04 [Psilocybe cubensis]KAH9486658.1 HMG box-containing protein C19G7.04 [Psilocybe cubensis]
MPTERRDIFSTRSNATFAPLNSTHLRNVEIVSDSEEDRQKKAASNPKHPILRKVVEIIEISSDERQVGEDDVVVTRSPTKPSAMPQTPRKHGWNGMPQYSKRRVIESSDEASSEPEIIELSDSSDDDEPPALKQTSRIPPAKETTLPLTQWKKTLDEAIIVFDEPRSARTPIRMGSRKPTSDVTKLAHDMDRVHDPKKTNIASSDHISNVVEGVSSKPIPGKSTKGISQQTSKRITKKAQLEAEQRRLHAYAQQLFNDLNKYVFNQQLPEGTLLNWNKRLLTTAGRAKYHRSRDGVLTTEIELAEKILDCDERIRNTLSHEMCHLATWVIDKKLDEHHGKLFKYWASRITYMRPDIHVSIKHDYEISYPYNWECAKCSKIYGRFSKSIRPDECRCGACKEGILVPLFKSRAKSGSKNDKLSRMAAVKAQGEDFKIWW